MKKNYLFLAAATTLFAACVQTDVVNDIPEPQQQAISFETFANKQTRAENSGAAYTENDLSNHHTTFKVWGYKNITTTKVFDGITVSYTDSEWDYVNQSQKTVYWDKTATRYDFYAAAPAIVGRNSNFWSLNNNSTDDVNTDDFITTAQFVIEDQNTTSYTTSPTQSFKDKGVTDLMIAAEKYLTKAVGDVPSDPVDLQFIHILSRLNVNVKATIDNVKVTNITVGNINSTGSFNENNPLGGTTLAGGTHKRWILVEDVTADNGSTTPAPVVSYTNTTSQPLTKDVNLIAIEALVIPQLAGLEPVTLNTPVNGFDEYDEPYLYIAYKINDEVYTQAFNLASAFGLTTGSLSFNEGWQNTLNITISPVAITFTADAAVWADQENKRDDNDNESQDDLTIQ